MSETNDKPKRKLTKEEHLENLKPIARQQGHHGIKGKEFGKLGGAPKGSSGSVRSGLYMGHFKKDTEYKETVVNTPVDSVEGEIALNRKNLDRLQGELERQVKMAEQIQKEEVNIENWLKKDQSDPHVKETIAKKQVRLETLRKYIPKLNLQEEVRKTSETINRLITTQKKENGQVMQEAQMAMMKEVITTLDGTNMGMKKDDSE
jgi:hypothetical protein